MKRPLHLVPDHISHDTVEALETLLKHAKEGKVLGISFAAMYKREYIVSAAGECRRSPTFALGMVDMITDYLRHVERTHT